MVGVFFVFGLIHAGRLNAADLSGLDVFRHLAGHIVLFDICLFLALAGIAVGIVAAEARPRPARAFGRSPLLSLGAGLLLSGLALASIINTNLQTLQADTYYKQVLAYEKAGQWCISYQI